SRDWSSDVCSSDLNNLTPKPLNKKIEESVISNTSYIDKYSKERNILSQVAESEMAYHPKVDYDKLIREKRKEMEKAAKELDFIKAAELRDEIKVLQDLKNK